MKAQEQKLEVNKDFAIRPIEAMDLTFVFSSWLKSYRGSMAVRGIGNNIYYKRNTHNIEQILERCTKNCMVATEMDDLTHILAYVVFENNVLHWVYVKHAFRKMGIATFLVNIFKNNANFDNYWMSYLPEDMHVFSWLKNRFDLEYDPERKNG